MEKATVKDLIARKMQRDEAKVRFYEIEVKSLGKTITIKHPTDEQRLDMMDELGTNPDARTMIEAYKKLIYNCCNMLHDKELHEELNIKDPYDVVSAIFDLDDITDIGEKLTDAMNDLPEKIKN